MYECVKCVSLGKSPWEWVGWVRSDNRWEDFAAQCFWLEAMILHCTVHSQPWGQNFLCTNSLPLLKDWGPFWEAFAKMFVYGEIFCSRVTLVKREGITGLLKTRQSIPSDCARLPHGCPDTMPSWPAAALLLQGFRKWSGTLLTPDYQAHGVEAVFVCMPVAWKEFLQGIALRPPLSLFPFDLDQGLS